MTSLFLEFLNMSISASWLIAAVIVIRLVLGKAPKGLRYILWALVAIRLLCPFSIESTLSLIPSAETISEESVYSDSPVINTGNIVVDQSDDVENMLMQENTPIVPEKNENPMPSILSIAAWVWGVGIVVMLAYSLISYIRLRSIVNVSVLKQDNLWLCDEIQSPFILGLIRPRIYLPSNITEAQIPYVVAHENQHLKYHDNWWKPLGFAILALHWFNPLVWAAYILLCRDIELACDERVIQSLNEDEKKQYSKSLLLCSNPRHVISACPVAFGEIGVKERIKSILNYKKPSVWIVGVGIVLCMVIAICFMTNPKENSEGDTENVESTEDTEDVEESESAENIDASEKIEESTELTGDHISVGDTLEQAELDWFENYFFNTEDNHMPNFFLASEYNTPKEVDFSSLFNNGSDGRGGGEITQEERDLLLQVWGEIYTDVSRATTEEINAVLQKYTGLTLEETNKVNIDSLVYLEEYDAYYRMAGDTAYVPCDILAGWMNEDGTITLRYKDGLSSNTTIYLVTLKEESDTYHFISNVKEELVVEVDVPDEELSLMQKVLLNKAEYNGGLKLADVVGMLGNPYEGSVNFYLVDFDQDGNDEVGIEYSGLVLILREKDGNIYGYSEYFRGMNPVYTDGTFSGSGGAAHSGFYGNVDFSENSFAYEVITSVSYGNEANLYYKGGEPTDGIATEITEEEYNQIMSAYEQVEVVKYEFTVENILKYVK